MRMNTPFLEGLAVAFTGHKVRVEEVDYPQHLRGTATFGLKGYEIALRRKLDSLRTFLHECAHIKLGHVAVNLPMAVQAVTPQQIADYYRRHPEAKNEDPYPTEHLKQQEDDANALADEWLRKLHQDYGAGVVEALAFGEPGSVEAALKAHREKCRHMAFPTYPITRFPDVRIRQ